MDIIFNILFYLYKIGVPLDVIKVLAPIAGFIIGLLVGVVIIKKYLDIKYR